MKITREQEMAFNSFFDNKDFDSEEFSIVEKLSIREFCLLLFGEYDIEE